MATVTPSFEYHGISNDSSLIAFTWNLTTANSDGSPMEFAEWADRGFTATGTWGGATLTIEGSNDGTTWVALKSVAGGGAATLSTNGALQIVEGLRYMRPNLTTVGVGAAVKVMVNARRGNPMRT